MASLYGLARHLLLLLLGCFLPVYFKYHPSFAMNPPSIPLPLSGVILAAGPSLNVGRDKAFVVLEDGNTLVSHQAALLRKLHVNDLLISARPHTDYGVPGAHRVYDAHHDAGPLAGIAAALAVSTQPHLLVVAVDRHRLTVPLLRKLYRQTALGQGVVPQGLHGFEPLCAVYPNFRDSRAFIDEALAAGRYSLETLLHSAIANGWMVPSRIERTDLPAFAKWRSPVDSFLGKAP